MALRNTDRAAFALLAFCAGAPLAGQAPAPQKLTFAAAVQRAAGTAPVVELAGLRTDEASARVRQAKRSEEHTSELQSHLNLVCRLLLEKKKKAFVCRPNGTSRIFAACHPHSSH